MKIRCIKNDLAMIIDEGQEINVYGIEYKNGRLRFLICEVEEHDFPLLFDADDFEIIDARMSKYWHLKIESDGLFISFKEMVEESHFNYKIVEGYPREKNIFIKYKKLMDDEF